MTEEPVTFDVAGESLLGIVSLPEHVTSSRALLVVVGGPQYRAGSHRQFTLLTRALARQGIPAMRFDYRGMGDSEGDLRIFESIGDDIRSAIDALCTRLPAVKEVVLWGLCDAASAILFYAWHDPRVAGIVLVNPWVYTPERRAKSLLRHHYLSQLRSREFWKRVFAAQVSGVQVVRSLWANIKASLPLRRATSTRPDPQQPLPERMALGLERYRGPVLLILSGTDLVAHQFKDCVAASRRWQRLLSSPRVTRHEISDAPHTFPSRVWRERVETWTAAWCAGELGSQRAV